MSSELDFLGYPECEPLSREQERALALRMLDGDVEARNSLVMANARFVLRLAERHKDRGVSLAELVQAGMIGLMGCLSGYKPETGYTVCTYAGWFVIRAILNAIAESAPQHEDYPEEAEEDVGD